MEPVFNNNQPVVSSQRSVIENVKLENKRIKSIGAAQLIVGLLITLSGIFNRVASQTALDVFFLSRVAAGIWVGIMVVITGLVCTSTSRSRQRKQIMVRTCIRFLGNQFLITTIFVSQLNIFVLLSVICIVLDVILLGVVIGDIVVASKAEIAYNMELDSLRDNFANATDMSCLNLSEQVLPAETSGEESVEIGLRCFAKSTFDQILASDILLIIFGLVELAIASHSLFVAYDITVREPKSRYNLTVKYLHRNRGKNGDFVRFSLPGVDETIANEWASDGNGMPSRDSFPDSDTFRSHIEVFDNGLVYNSNTNRRRSH